MNLTISPITFNAYDHTYTNPEGKRLSGITSLLSRQLFRDKYNGISKAVLDKAAERGTDVHESIDLYNSLGVESQGEELQAYRELIGMAGLTPVAAEYLVSDIENVASSIDVVFDDISLADVKTTSKLDTEYVRWQLSVYAYLFELQNPGLRVGRLLAIWLPKPRYGKPKLVEVARIGSEIIEMLIECDACGVQFEAPQGVADAPVVAEFCLLPTVSMKGKPKAECKKGGEVTASAFSLSRDRIDEIIATEREMKELKARYDGMKAGLLREMTEIGATSYKEGPLALTVKAATERESLDMARLKELYPEVYKDCLRVTPVKESLTLKTL